MLESIVNLVELVKRVDLYLYGSYDVSVLGQYCHIDMLEIIDVQYLNLF